jgi:hypothetical protein
MVLHQMGDLQVFVRDRVELPDQAERHLVVEILPLASHRLMRFGEQHNDMACSGLEGNLPD